MSHRDYPGGQIGHIGQMGTGTNSQSPRSLLNLLLKKHYTADLWEFEPVNYQGQPVYHDYQGKPV